MPRVTITRRRSRKPEALTAAAQRVDTSNPASFRRSFTGNTVNGWQAEAWRYLELVGELQYYCSWRAWSASRCRMLASAMDDEGAPMGEVPDDDPNATRVRQIVNDIAGGVSGQARILQRAAYLITVVGECWVGMVVRDTARETAPDGTPELAVDIDRPGYQREQWYVFNREQITNSPNGLIVKLPDGTKHEIDPDIDILFRVWQEHPADPSQPVSPIWSNRVVLNGIVQADATIKAANNSRLIGNGLLFVSQGMSLPSTQQMPTAYPQGGTAPSMPATYIEPNSAQGLSDLLFEVASTAKRDPESQAAMLPIIVTVPGEEVKNVQWLRPGSDIPETTLKIQEADIRRLAMGLDVAPERLLGMGDGNHWSVWAIDENDIKVHVAPLVELITSALTQEILREKLADEGIDPDLYLIWYDTTGLTQDPDKTADAKDAYDRGAISAAALRQHFGFDDNDGYDFESIDGWVQMALDKLAENPALAPQLLPILEAAAAKVGLDIAPAPPPPTIVQQALPPGADTTAPPTEQPAQPSTQEPTQPPPVQAAAVTVARLCVNRALELANKRRRTRADVAQLRDVPIELAHTRMDPVQQGEASDLIKGWAVGLADDDLEGLGLHPLAFRNAVEGVACLALVTASAPVLTPNMLRRL